MSKKTEDIVVSFDALDDLKNKLNSMETALNKELKKRGLEPIKKSPEVLPSEEEKPS